MVRRVDTIIIDSDDDDDDETEHYNATAATNRDPSTRKWATTMASSSPPPPRKNDAIVLGERRDDSRRTSSSVSTETTTTTTTMTTTTMTTTSSRTNGGGDGKPNPPANDDDAGGRSPTKTTTLERPPDASSSSSSSSSSSFSSSSMPSIHDAADYTIVDEDEEFDRAIRLSLLEEAEGRDGDRLRRIRRRRRRRASDDDCDDDYDDDDDACEDADAPPCRLLSRDEFKNAIDGWMLRNGGYDAIERGMIVKHGNANDMRRSNIADGGGMYQTGAEYGRYSIGGMYRVFEVLEGKADVGTPDEGRGGNGGTTSGDDGKDDRCRLTGPAGAKITAFVDIGHGIGIQVLQAGWSHGVPARGVEIMKGRHLVAEELLRGALDDLRSDPPNWDAVRLINADFSRAVAPDASGRIDDGLRRFLLFEDGSSRERRGLVIFVNNAEGVFGLRSNQNAKGQDLNSYLARLFGRMEIGGRMVTLEDITLHLTRETEWFRRDVFESGFDAVSWNEKKSVKLYVLTKIKNHWFCRNPTCAYKNFDERGIVSKNDGERNGLCEHCNGPMTELNEHSQCCRNEGCPCMYNAPIRVVDERTCELIETCAYCLKEAKRWSRTRNPTAKASEASSANNHTRKNARKRKGEDDSSA